MSVAISVVSIAARTLPAGMRDRYREQWLADLRDADEAGIRRSDIAFAAVSFAATLDRPLPSRPANTPELVQRHARFAAALALSTGLLGLAGVARLYGTSGLTGVVGYDLAMELSDTLLFAFAVVGSIVAVTIVTRTRAINARVRRAVWVLMIAAVAPIAHLVVDGFPLIMGDIYLPLGGLVYLPAAVAVVIALRLLWTGLTASEPRAHVSRGPILLSALAVLSVGAFGFGQAALAWASRTPISFSWQPAVASTMGADGAVVQWEIPTTQADYEQWIALKELFEWTVGAAFATYALVTIASVVAVVILAWVARIRPGILACAAIGILFIAAAALFWRLDWTAAVPLVAPELLLTAGRLLVVGVVLVAVGGVRYLPRVRHRHDIEGAV